MALNTAHSFSKAPDTTKLLVLNEHFEIYPVLWGTRWPPSNRI